MQLQGSGLFVFSDPGGAKPVLAIATTHSKELKSGSVISDREYPFFSDFNIPVKKYSGAPEDEIAAIHPDFIVTGTSYTSSIELDFIQAAKAAGIPVYAFIDHWTSIKERFIKDQAEVWPDKIWVVDDVAKQAVLETGFEGKNVEVIGNPYHEFLRHWQPAITKKEYTGRLGINPGSKIILYAPDPLSNVDGRSKFGFDEIEATAAIRQLAMDLQGDYVFLFAAHPNQRLAAVEHLLGNEIRLLPPGTDVNTSIYYADAVLGFFSNILLEARVFGKPVFRYFVREDVVDPFKEKQVGTIIYPSNAADVIKNSI